jgi:hypothetical protein
VRRPGGARGEFAVALRAVAAAWFGSRAYVALLAAVAAVVVRDARFRPSGYLALWDRWDVQLFEKVAKFGYLSPRYPDHTEVDFPGLPLLLRAVHLAVPSWTLAGILVSAVALLFGLAAVAALAETPAARSAAVLLLVAAPYAVFLFAGYSEALFLAFTATAWWAGCRGRWAVAAVLAAGATATRVTGVAFLLGLAVLYLERHRGRLRPDAGWLAVPVLPVVAFLAYLHARTGHWDAYTRAQQAGWGRTLAAPWTGWQHTWAAAGNLAQPASYLWFWRAELVAVLLGVALTLALLIGRRWGEASYVAASTLLMSATSYYASGVRVALVWFPLYLLLGRACARRPWLLWVLAVPNAALMSAFVVAFTAGQWVD